MKYICSTCKEIYNKNQLNIDSMSGALRCPKCGRLGGGVYTKEELHDKINYYQNLFQKLCSN